MGNSNELTQRAVALLVSGLTDEQVIQVLRINPSEAEEYLNAAKQIIKQSALLDGNVEFAKIYRRFEQIFTKSMSDKDYKHAIAANKCLFEMLEKRPSKADDADETERFENQIYALQHKINSNSIN